MKTATLMLTLVLSMGIAAAQSLELEFRLYDVTEITRAHPQVHGITLGHLGTLRYEMEMDDREPVQFLSVDALADYIRDTVEPRSWDSGGDVMGLEGGLLLVRNRPAVHAQVQQFLAGLASAAGQRIGFTVEVFELDDSRYASLPANRVPAGDAEKSDRAVTRVASGSGEAWSGVSAAVQVLNKVRFVSDYDVEIAQGSNISDPRVDIGIEGTVVELTARPNVDGSRLVVDTIVQHGAFDRPFRTLELGVDEEYFAEPYRSESMKNTGVLQLPVFHHQYAVATRIIPVGGTFTIPVVSEGRTLLFKITTKKLGGEVPDHVLNTSALCHRPERLFFGIWEEIDDDEIGLLAPRLQRSEDRGEPIFTGPEELLDFIIQNVAPWYWEEGEASINIGQRHDLFIRASDDILKAVRKFILDLEAQQLRQVHFDVRVLSTAENLEPGVRDAFPGGTPLHAGRVSTLPGQRTSFQLGNTLNYLADYDVEVAQEARISDPTIGQSFEGLVADLSPRISMNGREVVTHLKALISQRDPLQVFDSKTRFLGPIDLVTEHRHVVDTTVTIPLGKVFIIDAGPNHLVPGERLYLMVGTAQR